MKLAVNHTSDTNSSTVEVEVRTVLHAGTFVHVKDRLPVSNCVPIARSTTTSRS